jgi:hypothetical protein
MRNGTRLFTGIVALFLGIVLAISVWQQYIPRNDVEDEYDSQDMAVLVRRDSTILVPLWSIIYPVTSDLHVTIFHKNATAATTAKNATAATTAKNATAATTAKNATAATTAKNATAIIVTAVKNATAAVSSKNPTAAATAVKDAATAAATAVKDAATAAATAVKNSTTVRASPFNVTNVKLTTRADSILSYHGDFKPVVITKDKKMVQNYDNSNPSINIYDMNVTAKHNLEIKNTTDPYTIFVYFQNSTGIHRFPVSFTWPIKTMDFNIFTYFMIVLIGVIVSKYVKKIIDSDSKTEEGSSTVGQFEQKDYIWIGVSGVIALLIFSNFQQQINLTSHIIANISLAFGFGFGFDKILETGQRLAGSNKAK